jgi:amidase
MEPEEEEPVEDCWRLTACEVVELLKGGKVTPIQLIEEVEKRVKSIDKIINSITVTCFERARERAKSFVIPTNPPEYFLYGLPVLIKDEEAVSGKLKKMINLILILIIPFFDT